MLTEYSEEMVQCDLDDLAKTKDMSASSRSSGDCPDANMVFMPFQSRRYPNDDQMCYQYQIYQGHPDC
jgi:hypothetical protein